MTNDEYEIWLNPYTSLTANLILPEDEIDKHWHVGVKFCDNPAFWDDRVAEDLETGVPFRMDKVPAARIRFTVYHSPSPRLRMELHLHRGVNDLGKVYVSAR